MGVSGPSLLKYLQSRKPVPYTCGKGSGTLSLAVLCFTPHDFLGVLIKCECTLSGHYIIVCITVSTSVRAYLATTEHVCGLSHVQFT